ncbi:phage major capsid protein [Halobacillus sp. A5]|uniref:phage major capsid protein n=1 Tax=Halobacillus sp. A5 TaxID=2880263 RepID=UPI0020A66729|nr:phage major capsid protein [Halobacillus sp. A5]MCP3026001.1 phage major capsid protein [Halobacillus sp. A5]
MKKVDELKQMKANLKEEVRSLNTENKIDEASTKLEELRSLDKQIEIQMELDKEEQREVEIKMEKRENNNQKLETRTVFTKAVQGKSLTQEERALVQASVNSDGGYLVPEEIKNEINELKRQYKSAKEIIGTVPVTTEAGSFVQEDLAGITELVNFDEDNSGLDEQKPKFRNIEYKVANYGSVTPISRSFLQDETANFMNFLNGHFAKKAIRTENAKIFAALKTGKTAKAVTDLKSLKKIVNVDIDPAIKALAVMAMNQDAFNALDEMEDNNGRPLLQKDPANPTQYLVLGLPVHVYSNAELPSVDGQAPMFIGATSEGAKFFDRGVYEVAVSTEAGFTKNQNVARVVERFDVKQADTSAYVLAEIDVLPEV